MYRIRAVDGQDEDVADILTDVHRLTFFDAAAIPDFEQGHWWLAYLGDMPVGFAGVIPSTHVHNAGYFSRVGGAEEPLRQQPAVTVYSCSGGAGASKRLECRRFGYHRQCRLGEQFHQGGLSVVSTEVPLGVAAYALLAQVHALAHLDVSESTTESAVRTWSPLLKPSGRSATGLFCFWNIGLLRASVRLLTLTPEIP